MAPDTSEEPQEHCHQLKDDQPVLNLDPTWLNSAKHSLQMARSRHAPSAPKNHQPKTFLDVFLH